MSDNPVADQREHIKQLEADLRAARKELDTLRPLAVEAAYRQAGIEPGSEQAKAAARLHGDGPITAESLAELRSEFPSLFAATTDNDDGGGESQPAVERDPASQARSDAIARTTELRGLAEPVGVQRVSYEDLKKIQVADPMRAFELAKSGRVDYPPDLQAAMNHNRMERNNQLVVTGGDV